MNLLKGASLLTLAKSIYYSESTEFRFWLVVIVFSYGPSVECLRGNNCKLGKHFFGITFISLSAA